MRKGALATAVALLLAVPSSAVAAPLKLEGSPAIVVTATTPDGRAVTLQVQDSNQGLCAKVVAAGIEDSYNCQRPSSTPSFDAEGLRQEFDADPAPTVYLSGVVSPRTAHLEVHRRHAATLRIATVPGEAYTGRYAGRVRFYLLAVAGEPAEVGLVRARDAAGRVLAAAEDIRRTPVVRSMTLFSRRPPGRQRVRVVASIRRLLDPAPGRPERRSRSLCFLLTVGTDETQSSFSCGPLAVSPRKLTGSFFESGGGHGCGPRLVAVFGTVSRQVVGLELGLAHRRVVRVSTYSASPLGLRSLLYVRVLVAASASARRLDVYGPRRRHLDAVDLRPPFPIPGCGSAYGGAG